MSDNFDLARGRGATVQSRNDRAKTSALRRLACAAIALFCVTSAATAQEAKLLFATTLPAGTTGPRDLIAPWVKRVNELGKGSLVVEQRDGPTLATMGNSYDRVMADVVQIAWGLQPLLGGKFPLSEVAELPFMSASGEKSSVALWRLYKTGLLDSEYQDIVPLWLTVAPSSKIHFARAPKSPMDWSGLKINVFNRILFQVVEVFGGTPVSFGPEQQYQALQRGTVNGVMTAWSGFDAYKLQEVSTYHVDASFGTSVHMFFMSRKRFDALPAAARKALQDASGEAESRISGKFLDDQEKLQREKVERSSKQKIFEPTPAQLADWKRKTDPILAEWAKKRPNGEKILAIYRKILADVEAGK
jgi:TRAP-type transport system periplasmic protein